MPVTTQPQDKMDKHCFQSFVGRRLSPRHQELRVLGEASVQTPHEDKMLQKHPNFVQNSSSIFTILFDPQKRWEEMRNLKQRIGLA
mmetsp:Transcript_1425/g.8776  ORF Transcript_1425/g.8776 Transcript_1425/m.8776 type:complete len:86 (-) Transcript_1425:3205-3462(-)